MNKPLVLTFRCPTPIPLDTQNKYAFDTWFRINLNQLVRLYTEFCKTNKDDSFTEYAESMFTSDRSIVNPELN